MIETIGSAASDPIAAAGVLFLGLILVEIVGRATTSSVPGLRIRNFWLHRDKFVESSFFRSANRIISSNVQVERAVKDIIANWSRGVAVVRYAT